MIPEPTYVDPFYMPFRGEVLEADFAGRVELQDEEDQLTLDQADTCYIEDRLTIPARADFGDWRDA